MIRKQGSRWVLRSKSTGAVLGRFKAKADAVAQERAIQIHKHLTKGIK
jgi:hypothetical protein